MANLRKRVAACDLTRNRPTTDDPNANETEQEQLDNRPLLPKVCGKHINFFFQYFHFMMSKKAIHNTFFVPSATCHIS